MTDHICKKLIFRHPHVFGTAAADTSEEVLVNWEALKRQEKGQQTTADAMDAVARCCPPSGARDKKTPSKAAAAGFEFADVSGALDKLDEETRGNCARPPSAARTSPRSLATCSLPPSRPAAF